MADIHHLKRYSKWIAQSPFTKDICGALRDLVPCAHFKKCEKHPWRGVTFS